jgi:hypothetical protein
LQILQNKRLIQVTLSETPEAELESALHLFDIMLSLVLRLKALAKKLKFLVGFLCLEDLHGSLFWFFGFLLWRGKYHLGALSDEGKCIS